MSDLPMQERLAEIAAMPLPRNPASVYELWGVVGDLSLALEEAEAKLEAAEKHNEILAAANRDYMTKLEAVRGLQRYTLVDNQYVPVSEFVGQWMQRPMIFADELEALLNKEQIK